MAQYKYANRTRIRQAGIHVYCNMRIILMYEQYDILRAYVCVQLYYCYYVVLLLIRGCFILLLLLLLRYYNIVFFYSRNEIDNRFL